jgi:hypothetical protein
MKWILGLALAAGMLWTSAAMAQGGPATGRYAPSRPVISPWLYLSRGSVGGVPAYQAWVQPVMNARAEQQYNDQRFNQIEGSLLREPVRGAGTPSTAARFMDYSHFYQQSSGAKPGVGR